MTIRPEALPEREKQVLRLLLSGHDAKSIGTALAISTNIVNEAVAKRRQGCLLRSNHIQPIFLGTIQLALPGLILSTSKKVDPARYCRATHHRRLLRKD